jgi:phosphohistidine phosphatase
MKNILLLRHAKSSWDEPGLADHDRPLSRRGERAATVMAEYVAARAPRPDLILCSTATRTRQTLAPLIKRLGKPAPPVVLERDLYLATQEALLARLRALHDDVGVVLMIGHNDGIGLLAEHLAGDGKAKALATLQLKFPTGALAELKAPIHRWPDLGPGSAKLTTFIRPRDLLGS